MIAGVLLAAGGARRFGSQKLVAPLEGAPLVRHAAETLAGSVDAVIVVVGNDGLAVREALRGVDVQIVENPDWATGLASSLRCGVAELGPDVDAVVVMLGDQPGVDPGVVRALIEAWRAAGSPIVAARYRDVRGHPVLFDRSVFGELGIVVGDMGAKPVLDRVPERVVYVEVDAETPRDVDTPDDLDRLQRCHPEEQSDERSTPTCS